jgi:hypothetical protein
VKAAEEASNAVNIGVVSSRTCVAAGRRTAIVVLGMHRSGTSALTRILNFLGAALPRRLMAGWRGNEGGHFEPEKLVAFHDALLAEVNSSWDDWTALDLAQLTARRRDRIKARIATIINADYGDASLFVIKDPRICRFAPLFLEALTDTGVTPEIVLMLRNPLEVAQSLERRDGMARTHAGVLWLRHVLDAEAATRGRPRAVLFYDDLLADWKRELRRVMSAIGPRSAPGAGGIFPVPVEGAAAEIDSFLSPAQRHHALSDADITGDPAMSSWCVEVYRALRELRQDPAPATALAAIDRVRREFDSAAPARPRNSSLKSWISRQKRTYVAPQLAALRGAWSLLRGA